MDWKMAVLLAAGLAVRLALVAYGAWQDTHMRLRYTDVDYDVITDAAGFVVAGGSPYQRTTYRYSPLIAWALIPGHLLRIPHIFGKLVFSFLDVLAAWLLSRCCCYYSSTPSSPSSPTSRSHTRELWVAGSWLFNPLSVNISTRGNYEAIVCCLVAACLWSMTRKKLITLAVCLGLAVHIRIYPVIYAFPLLFYVRSWDSPFAVNPQRTKGVAALTAKKKKGAKQSSPLRSLFSIFTPAQWVFGVVCFGTFAAVTLLCYAVYRMDFLENTYLYHLTRTDHRHNLSTYWYHLCLSMYNGAAAAAQSPSTVTTPVAALALKLASFLPQIAAMVAVGVRFFRSGFFKDAAFGMWAMTAIFVAFNKVYTVQYFAWWLIVAPLAGLTDFGALRVVRFFVLWIGALLVWLKFAYRLEFLGEDTFYSVWICGLALFVASVEPVIELCWLKNKLESKQKSKTKKQKST